MTRRKSTYDTCEIEGISSFGESFLVLRVNVPLGINRRMYASDHIVPCFPSHAPVIEIVNVTVLLLHFTVYSYALVYVNEIINYNPLS
jgi:hypothetical protein